MSEENKSRWAGFAPDELRCLWTGLAADTGTTAYRLRGEIYKALHPQPPTPEEPASQIVAFFGSGQFDNSLSSDAMRFHLRNEIAAAIRADREAIKAAQ